MNKLLVALVTILSLTAAIFIGYLLLFKTIYQNILFTSSDQPLNNPSRGFYRQISTDNLEGFKELSQNERLVLAQYDLDDYKEIKLSKEKLRELNGFLNAARQNGVKVIFRAGYGFTGESEYNDIASLERVKEHIAQISPILNENKDIIFCVQAGFIGPWGEWHSSLLLKGKTDEEQIKVRNTVLYALIDGLDPEIIINVRRPSFIRDAQNSGIDITRIGFHNDGLLSTESDYGTYQDLSRKEELDWCDKNIVTGINGGEMPLISKFTDPKNAKKEFHMLKLSYLNAHYNKEVLDMWQGETLDNQNAGVYLENHLGYRLRISKINMPKKLLVNAKAMKTTISFVNDGFAPIEAGYTAKLLVYVEGRLTDEYSLTEDLRSLTTSIEKPVEIHLTQEMLVKGFSLSIRLQDGAASLINDNSYAIELANNESTYHNGENQLLSISIDKRNVTYSFT